MQAASTFHWLSENVAALEAEAREEIKDVTLSKLEKNRCCSLPATLASMVPAASNNPTGIGK
jgi:hypothetical protein